MATLKLTKSKFKLALECPTKLYYIDKSQYANQKMEDSFLKALAEGGYQVEALARCYFPDGIFVVPEHKESVLDATKRLLETESITLFEAEILHQGYLIRTDILITQVNLQFTQDRQQIKNKFIKITDVLAGMIVIS